MLHKPAAPIRSILFIHYGDNWIRGSERCLLDTLKACQQANIRTTLWCNSAALTAAVSPLGTEVYLTPMSILWGYDHTRWNLWGWWQQYRFTRALLATKQPDIVHINSGAPAQWAVLACRQAQVPVVTQLHAHYGVLKDRVTLGLHQCPHLVGVSYAALRAFIDDGMAPERLRIIPNGIDAERLQQQKASPLKQALGLNADAILLLSVGSLISRKGHRFLFQALAQMRNQGKILYTALIGDGPESAPLKAYAQALGIHQQVFFLGECSEAFGIMQGDADALVSTATDEVFGLVLAEANLAKLPVIAPNIVGINSVIKHKRTGWLYQANNVNALCSAIESLADKEAWRIRINKGFYRAATTFSIARQQQQLLSAYEEARQQYTPPSHLGLKLLMRGIGMRLQRVFHHHKLPLRWSVSHG